MRLHLDTSLFIRIQGILLILWFIFRVPGLIIPIELAALFLLIVNKLGQGIILRETVALHTAFILLLMPFIGYVWYPYENPLAKLWVKYMPVDSSEYFGFIMPGVLIFNMILCWPIRNASFSDEGNVFLAYSDQIKRFINSRKFDGKILIFSGIFFFFINDYIPSFLQYVSYIIFLLSFAGALILYFKQNASLRIPVLILFLMVIIYTTLRSGMFTIVAYMGMTVLSFLFIGRKMSFYSKLLVFISILVGGLIIQNAKASYRSLLTTEAEVDSRAAAFGKLLVQQSNEFSGFLNSENFFFFYTRANQGLNVSYVMEYIPEYKEFDYGSFLGEVFVSAFIPRLFWPNKPEAGGRFNMLYFANIVPTGNTSTNVSPFGEAYGSFGPVWGIVYMGFLGAFIRWSYLLVFKIWRSVPFMLFYLPVLFYQVTYSMETDSLQIFNSLIKSAIFLYVLYRLFPVVFGLKTRSPLESRQPTWQEKAI